MTSPVLRLRDDVYYQPLRDGVRIRTAGGSFTMRGRGLAECLRRLAPSLDRGVTAERLYAALRPDQVGVVAGVLEALAQRDVLWRESAAPGGVGPAAGTGRNRVAVVGPDPGEMMRRAFRDVGFELDGGAPPHAFVALFPAGGADAVGPLVEAAVAQGAVLWVGLRCGRALLVKGYDPAVGGACPRCAWRRLVHASASGTASLRAAGSAAAAAVVSRELADYLHSGDTGALHHGTVLDLDTWTLVRSAIDPDPTCTLQAAHAQDTVATRPQVAYPNAVLAARCFGPVASCAPEDHPQIPLAVVRVRVNAPGRDAPVTEADGPLVAGTSMADARAEGLRLAVEAAARAAGAGPDLTAATARAVVHWSDRELEDDTWRDASAARPGPAGVALAALSGDVPGRRHQRHPSGLWRARVTGGPWFSGLSGPHADLRATLWAIARDQLGDVAPVVVPACADAAVPVDRADSVARELNLCSREVALPALVGTGLVGVVVSRDGAA